MDTDNRQLERDIENAIRARGLKEQMQLWESERKQQTKPSLWPKLRHTIYTLSAVAVLAGIVVMAVPTSVWKSSYRQASRWAYRQYAHYFQPSQPKGPTYEHTINELMAMAEPTVNQIVIDRYELEILGHEDLIQEAIMKIQKAEYAMAEDILSDAREALNTDDAHYEETIDDIVYLEAICQLGQGHRNKAKKLLNTIAESSSQHSKAAAKLAEEIK